MTQIKPMPTVSPEEFERFCRGEMTRDELIEILKKASYRKYDNVLDDDYVPFLDKCGEQYVPN
jgi:hypothetical protein